MPHHYTEGFENDWTLVRETASSQKWRVATPEGQRVDVDIHYTAGKMLTVNLSVEGRSSKGMLSPILNEVGRLGLYRQDYAVIDYTLAECESLFDGNYSIDESDRTSRQL